MKRLKLLIVPATLSLCGCVLIRPDLAARVVTGTTAHDLCSETFVSGRDPEQTFEESLKPRPGFKAVAGAVKYEVDREQQQVRATFAGGFESLAVYRGRDGCLLVSPEQPPAGDPLPAFEDAPAMPLPVSATTPEMAAVLEAAFAENRRGPARNTKAVVVLHQGRVVGEQYAEGYDGETPVLGFSLAKSIVNTLVGLLVAEGRLQLEVPLLDARETSPLITLGHGLRMTTGLDLDETGSGLDPSNHMLYVYTDDMAAFAGSAEILHPPGERWFYSSATTHLVSRVLRDTVGGAEAIQQYAHERLFVPLGLQHMTVETDETGTPVGAHYMLGSPHDWARLGLFFLHDGVAPDGQRLLPADWVQWSTTPTLNTNYGAGWWINHRAPGAESNGEDMKLMPDVPPDAFYALGNLGQYVVVVPSQDLVVVRLGRAHTSYFDVDGMNALVSGAIEALSD